VHDRRGDSVRRWRRILKGYNWGWRGESLGGLVRIAEEGRVMCEERQLSEVPLEKKL